MKELVAERSHMTKYPPRFHSSEPYTYIGLSES